MPNDDDAKRAHQMRTGDRIESNRRLDRVFAIRRSPSGQTNQARYIRSIRQAAREFAQTLIENTAVCADQSSALRAIRQAVLWAEEAIHLEGME